MYTFTENMVEIINIASMTNLMAEFIVWVVLPAIGLGAAITLAYRVICDSKVKEAMTYRDNIDKSFINRGINKHCTGSTCAFKSATSSSESEPQVAKPKAEGSNKPRELNEPTEANESMGYCSLTVGEFIELTGLVADDVLEYIDESDEYHGTGRIDDMEVPEDFRIYLKAGLFIIARHVPDKYDEFFECFIGNKVIE